MYFSASKVAAMERAIPIIRWRKVGSSCLKVFLPETKDSFSVIRATVGTYDDDARPCKVWDQSLAFPFRNPSGIRYPVRGLHVYVMCRLQHVGEHEDSPIWAPSLLGQLPDIEKRSHEVGAIWASAVKDSRHGDYGC